MSRRREVVLVVAGALFGTVTLLFTVTLVRDDFVAGDVNARYVCLVFASTLFAIAVGVGAAIRRPSAHAGWLLAAAARGPVRVWRFSPRPLVAAVALALFYATALLPLHALVVQGDGVGAATRRFLLGADIVLALLGLVIVGTAAGGTLRHWFIAAASFRHVDNPLVVVDAPGVARAFQTAWWTTLVVVAAVATAFRLRAWGRSPRNVRRRGTVIAVASIAWVLMMLGSALSLSISRQLGARVTLANYGVVLLPAFGLAVAAAALGWVELVEPRLARRTGGRVELSAIDPTGRACVHCSRTCSGHRTSESSTRVMVSGSTRRGGLPIPSTTAASPLWSAVTDSTSPRSSTNAKFPSRWCNSVARVTAASSTPSSRPPGRGLGPRRCGSRPPNSCAPEIAPRSRSHPSYVTARSPGSRSLRRGCGQTRERSPTHRPNSRRSPPASVPSHTAWSRASSTRTGSRPCSALAAG